jgi:HEAT repeat protein
VTTLLQDRDPSVLAQVLWQLVATPRPTLIPAIEPCLRNEHWQVRRAACRALGASRSERSTPVLLERIRDQHVAVRDAALRALSEVHREMTGQVVADQLATSGAARRAALLYALDRIDPSMATDAVQRHDTASDPAELVRIAVCHILDPDQFAGTLERLADDPDAGVRNAADRRRSDG